MNQLFTTLEEDDKVTRKSVKKRISRITNRLRRDHLKTYDGTAEFSEIFRNGNYNDATATLLYALAFERFDVPFAGYVDHWEAYLVADPERRRTAVRNPAARKHRAAEERTFRREYLALVRATVAPDLGSLSTAGADSLFYNYYYRPDRRLSFGQLAAYQQLRRAQAAYAAHDYPQAIQLLARAVSRESRPAFLVLDQAVKLQLAALNRPEVEGEIGELFQQWSEKPTNRYLAAAILNHFDDRQELLLAEGNESAALALLDEYRTRAPAGKKDWIEELQTLQSLRLIVFYERQGRLTEAERTAEILYDRAPDNAAYRHVLSELILNNLRRSKLDNEELRRRVEIIADKHPFLRERDRYATLLLRERALKVRDLFAAGSEFEALKALETFRTSLLSIPIGKDRNLWTLTAFLAASTYYFQREDYQRARLYVEEALKYGPDEDYLLHRQEVLRRY